MIYVIASGSARTLPFADLLSWGRSTRQYASGTPVPSTSANTANCQGPEKRGTIYVVWEWSIANAIDYRGLLAELVPSSILGPRIRGLWEFLHKWVGAAVIRSKR